MKPIERSGVYSIAVSFVLMLKFKKAITVCHLDCSEIFYPTGTLLQHLCFLHIFLNLFLIYLFVSFSLFFLRYQSEHIQYIIRHIKTTLQK